MLPRVQTIEVLMNTRRQTVRANTDLAQLPSFANSLRYILWGLTQDDVPYSTCSSEIRSPWLRQLLSKQLLRAPAGRTTPRVYGLVRVVYEQFHSTAAVNYDAPPRRRHQHLICDLEQWTVKGTFNGQHFTIPQHRPNADLQPLELQSLESSDFTTSTLKAAFEEGFGRKLTDADMKRGITELLNSNTLDASEISTGDRFKPFLDAWRAFSWGIRPENLTRFLSRAWADIEMISQWDKYYCIGLSHGFTQLDLAEYEQVVAYIAGGAACAGAAAAATTNLELRDSSGPSFS